MGTTWKSFGGDTARFAIEISFDRDPDEGAGASPEESGSWGSLRLWANGLNLTAHTELGESVSAAHWYMLPVLEWLAESWDPLFHEEHLPNANRGDDAVESLHRTRFPEAKLSEDDALAWEQAWQGWWWRHSLQAARSGGLLPDVVLRRWRHDVELSWGDGAIAGVTRDVRWDAGEGRERFAPEEVSGPTYTVLAAAAEQLSRAHPDSARIKSLVANVKRLPEPQRLPERCGWMSGLGAAAESAKRAWESLEERAAGYGEGVRDALFGASSDGLVVTRAPTVAQMFGSMAPSTSDADVGRVLEFLAEVASDEDEAPDLADLSREEPLDREMSAADQGYLLAEEAVESLGVDDSRQVDIRALLDRLHIDAGEIEFDDRGIRGLSVAGDGFRPIVAVNVRYPWDSDAVRRFTLAHELCHVLFDRAKGRRLAVASGPWAPREIEQRANAFAAMLLLPTRALASAIAAEGTPDSWEVVKRIGKRLGASPSTVLEHLHNRGYIEDFDYDRLRDPSARGGERKGNPPG
jgi:Zn-dependent peptidase ImmA (M78 family)